MTDNAKTAMDKALSLLLNRNPPPAEEVQTALALIEWAKEDRLQAGARPPKDDKPAKSSTTGKGDIKVRGSLQR